MGLWEQLLVTYEMFRSRVHLKFPVHAVYGCTNTVFHGIKPNRVPYRQLITRSQTVRVPLPSHGTVQPWIYGMVRSPILNPILMWVSRYVLLIVIFETLMTLGLCRHYTGSNCSQGTDEWDPVKSENRDNGEKAWN